MGGIYSFSSGGAVYRFSRRIGRGGMGEVYLGLQEGIGGLERLVVIKRIYPQFGEDEHFTRMLLEEARLAASIRHPNVVQILDIGRDDDGYFIVMEYLSGETLVYITRSLRARDEAVPPAIACRFAAEVAAGLHCAHTATDPVGNPQPIVHRDVTPSNLILCFNGVVKIVDFGVAKATLHEGHTRGGIKGKMSYLAPEQLYDQPVDGRTDVFQLGICLHELLTGQRLFKGDSDQQRAVAVLERPIPAPREIVPSLPKELDEVVMWSLQRDPARRPASADEFRRALEGAAVGIGSVSGHDLGGWMKSSFADRLVERTQFERQCVAEMREGRSASSERMARDTGNRPPAQITGPLSKVGDSQEGMGSVRQLPVRGRVPSLSPPPSGSDSRPAYHGYNPHGTSHSPPPPQLSPAWKMTGVAGLVILVGAGIAVAWAMGGSSSQATTQPAGAATLTAAPAVQTPAPAPPAPPTAPTIAPLAHDPATAFEVAVTVVPSRAAIILDGVEVGRGSYRAVLPRDGTRHIMSVQADGYEEVGLDFTDQPPPARVELDPVRSRAGHRQVRKAPASSGGKKAVRTRVPESEPDDALTDNPDPWAEDPSKGKGEGRSEE